MADIAKIITLIPDGEGNITIPGAIKHQYCKSNGSWVGYYPKEKAPKNYGVKYYYPVYAVAMPHDPSINQWLVVSDEGNWSTIDPLNAGVEPKDMKSTYRFWELEAEYTDPTSAKLITVRLSKQYDKSAIPDFTKAQQITINVGETQVQADVKKATPSTGKDLAGLNLHDKVKSVNITAVAVAMETKL